MNILTKGTGNKSGGKIKQEIGSFGKLRTSIGYNTGKLKNGWGLTIAGHEHTREKLFEEVFFISPIIKKEHSGIIRICN